MSAVKKLLKLQNLLLKGPRAKSYKTDLWTLQQIARLVRKHFGINYYIAHVR